MVGARPFPVALSKPALPILLLTQALSPLAPVVEHLMVCFTGRYLLLLWVPKLLCVGGHIIPDTPQLWLRLSSTFPENP